MRTYSFFIPHAGSSTPTLEFELAGDEVSLRSLAEHALSESPSRLAVEIRPIHQLSGPLRGREAVLGHRPAGGDLRGCRRNAVGHDVRGDLHRVLQFSQHGLRVL